jgi:peptide/nickel transport system permease protein
MASTGNHKRSRTWYFIRLFTRNKAGMVGLFMLLFVIFIAVFAPFIAPYDPYERAPVTSEDFMAPPSSEHWLGQDDTGKDVLSSVIYGARVSLVVGFSAAMIVLIIGGTIGMMSGSFGGATDLGLMRLTDAVLVIPRIPLMLVIIAVAGRSLTNIILVVGLLSWSYMARIVRSQVLTVKERKYILRARAIGVSDFGVMLRHIFPQVVPVIFAVAILDISYAILSEATLSFLGLGDPTLISWGSMLNRAFMRGAVTRGAWWYIIPPGLALAWVTLGLYFLANAIQEIINPRLRTHHLFDENKMVAKPQSDTQADPVIQLLDPKNG